MDYKTANTELKIAALLAEGRAIQIQISRKIARHQQGVRQLEQQLQSIWQEVDTWRGILNAHQVAL